MEQTLLEKLQEGHFDIQTFADIKCENLNGSGLYVIDDIYVGRAEVLIDRFWEHIRCPIRGGHNDDLTNYIKTKFSKNEKIKIVQCCLFEEKEKLFIEEKTKYFYMLNKQFAVSKKIREGCIARREKKIMEIKEEQLKTSLLLNEIVGNAQGNDRYKMEMSLIGQLAHKLQVVAAIDNRLRETVLDLLLNAFNEIKFSDKNMEMNGDPSTIPSNILELEKPIIEKPVLITEEQPAKVLRYAKSERDNGINFSR